MDAVATVLDDLGAWLAPMAARQQVPGTAVGVARDGVAATAGYGWRDVAGRQPMTGDTVMGIASCTKSFTALAACRLAEAGRVTLADPVAQYFPDFLRVNPRYGERVTVHHLLTHTAGLPDYSAALNARTKWGSYSEDQRTAWRRRHPDIGPPILTTTDLLAAMAAEGRAPLAPPGARYHYSNEGYALVGALVEQVSGVFLPAFLAREILSPLAMGRSFLRPPTAADAPVTTLYERGRSGPARLPTWPHAPATLGDGFLRTTADDFLRYARWYLTPPGERPPLVSAAMQRRMWRRAAAIPAGAAHPGADAYGYGWMVGRWGRRQLVSHTGSMSGVGSFVGIVPSAGVAVVVLQNRTGAPAVAVGRRLLAALCPA